MSIYIPSDNKLVTCPYDEAHKVKESRLQLHIAKCKLNHLDLAKRICPFNATHLLQQGEYDHHLINCPDRDSLDRQLAQSVNRNNPYKGRTAMPQFSHAVHVEEVWEDESQTLVLAPPPPGAVIEPRAMAKPAERRKLYKDLHQVTPGTENDKDSSPSSKSQSSKRLPTPRQPKQPSGVQVLQTANHPNAQAMQGLGLGRGRQSSRIAANIFPAANGPSESVTYSNIVKDMGNLGIGRGQPKQDNRIFDNEDDFPALGCGRGALLAPKQSLRTPGAKPEK